MMSKWIALPTIEDALGLRVDLSRHNAVTIKEAEEILSNIPIKDVGRAKRVGDKIIVEIDCDGLTALRYVYQIPTEI